MEKSIKVLLLEQLAEDAKLVESELIKGNIIAKTLVVNNKPDFVKALTEFAPDVILSDHTLPDFHSIEALSIVKQSKLDIPFILTTSAVSEEFAVKALQEGADDYILKANLSRLPAAVNNVISRRKTRAAEAREQEEKNEQTRLLFRIENSAVGYIEWTVPDPKIKSISQRALEIFGLTRDDLLEYAESGYIEVYKEDLALAKEKAMELMDGVTKSNTAEHKNYKKDGSVLYCEWFNSALKDDNGKVIAIMSLVQDITARKEHEANLQQSEERYRRIVETSQEGIWTIDENNNTNFVNNRICRLLEFSRGEIMGKQLIDFMDEKGRKIAEEILERQKTEPVESFECSFFTRTGREVCTIISTNAIFGERQEYLGALAMVTDITERERSGRETLRMVESLKNKNKDLGQFAYMVSHNLRAPISKIQGLVMLFGNTSRDISFDKLLLSNIAREAINLDNVVKDMNEIITTRDSENLRKDFFVFEDNVKLIKLALHNEIKESTAVITTNFDDIQGIDTVKSYVYSIIFNLVSNSIKYRRIDEPLKIHISTKFLNDFMCFSVKDNGSGIDLEKYGEKIFGLYKRFHESEVSGRGLGLNMVKTQAESLGGRAEVESIVNQGSTFRIYLPLQ